MQQGHATRTWQVGLVRRLTGVNQLEGDEEVCRDRRLVLILLRVGKAESLSTAVLIFAGLGASPSPLIIP